MIELALLLLRGTVGVVMALVTVGAAALGVSVLLAVAALIIAAHCCAFEREP